MLVSTLIIICHCFTNILIHIFNKDNFIFLENIVYPSANEMSKLSFEKFLKNDFEDLAYFEPLYLKEGVQQT